MAKLRHGRKQAQNIYLQLGDEPSDDDAYIGVIFDPVKAQIIIEMVNDERPSMGVMKVPWRWPEGVLP